MADTFSAYLCSCLRALVDFKYDVNIYRYFGQPGFEVRIEDPSKVWCIPVPEHIETRSPFDIAQYVFNEFEKLKYGSVKIQKEEDYYRWLAARL